MPTMGEPMWKSDGNGDPVKMRGGGEPYRNQQARSGRNERCACGSGEKYKNCCSPTSLDGVRWHGLTRHGHWVIVDPMLAARLVTAGKVVRLASRRELQAERPAVVRVPIDVT